MPAIGWHCIEHQFRFFHYLFPHAFLDSRYNFGYTRAMKTAISIPDTLFHAAEQFAHAKGLSRSELYARALHWYLQSNRPEDITQLLNEVYADEDSTLDPAITAAQLQIVAKEDW